MVLDSDEYQTSATCMVCSLTQVASSLSQRPSLSSPWQMLAQTLHIACMYYLHFGIAAGVPGQMARDRRGCESHDPDAEAVTPEGDPGPRPE